MTRPIYPHNGHLLGQRLRALRLERGWLQRDAAERVGMSEGALARIERGVVARPTEATIQALARAFDVAPDTLIPPPVSEAQREERDEAEDGRRETDSSRRNVYPPPAAAPALVALADAIQAYDPAALVVAGLIESDITAGGIEAVAVMFSDGDIRLFRHKDHWTHWLAEQGDVTRLRDALDAAARLPVPPRRPEQTDEAKAALNAIVRG